ncbi:histidine phosphatase family protein [Glaciimonas sp. PAMC28666]|uniref:histidine phosphatase family protein n=1 Tax=Glaciimonas sp. PAMC28666 TaxID=2807626 RepID=UPI001962B3DC|nr:histidine phosphatase family protein [Glaciimonas sp. PAMC28666]QRX84878.1 histidine phosphatase family protein [Glaciimonas sp. PAMC28666]
MAEFYLVRHGQASFGTDNYDRLSPLGHQQSKWLGQYFAERDIQFDRVIVGTQLRHRQTAEGIFHGNGQIPVFSEHPGLNEYDFYALFNAVGEEHADLKRLTSGDKHDFYVGLKQVLQLWAANQLSGPLPESWNAFAQRVRDALLFIQQCGGQRILVVSSGGPSGMIGRQVLEAPANIAIELNLQVRNTSFSHYYFNQQAIKLASFNNIPHLDQPDRLSAITYG